MKLNIWIMIAILEIPLLYWCGETKRTPRQDLSLDVQDAITSEMIMLSDRLKRNEENDKDLIYEMKVDALFDELNKDTQPKFTKL